MTNQEITATLRQDGYHTAADRMEELLDETAMLICKRSELEREIGRLETKLDYLGKGKNVPTASEKGATDFDKLCHTVFDADGENYRARKAGVTCHCGCELEYYYCEEQLLLIQCPYCKAKALVKARSPRSAAYKTLASAEEVE